MQPLRALIATSAGAWLYFFAVVQVGGVLAAIAVPKEYFHFFGAGNGWVALLVLYLLTWATPVALLVAGGLISMLRLAPSVFAQRVTNVLFGMAAAFLYWNVFLVVQLLPEVLPAAFFRALEITFIGPVWSLPNLLAPWLGFGLAAWVAHPNQLPASRGGA